MKKIELFFYLAALAIGLAAMGYGFWKLCLRPADAAPRPLYFQMYFWAQCCFVIAMMSDTVNLLCQGYEKGFVTVGLIGHFGVYWTLLSANCNQIDSVVDDRKDARTKKARLFAWTAPAIMIFLLYLLFDIWRKQGLVYGVFVVLALSPIIRASYYNLKHLLLPMDALGLMAGTVGCNIFALAVYAVRIAYYFALAAHMTILSGILLLGYALAMTCVTVSAVKGAKKWNF